jgi:hypothetical protein
MYSSRVSTHSMWKSKNILPIILAVEPTPSGVVLTSASAMWRRHSSSNASKKWCGSWT